MDYEIPDTQIKSGRNIDWSRYGLRNADGRSDDRSERFNNDLNPDLYQTGANELFAQEFVSC